MDGQKIPMPHLELTVNILKKYYDICIKEGITNPDAIPKMIEEYKRMAMYMCCCKSYPDGEICIACKARIILKEMGIK